MNFKDIQKRPIIIFSTPRSGSTILAMNVATYFSDSNIKFFNEIIHYNRMLRNSSNFTEFNKFVETNNNYILKTHLWDFIKYFPVEFKNHFNEQVNNFYLIRIRRKDIAAQLVSYYIAMQRKTWIYKSTDEINEDVEFAHFQMKLALPMIKLYNKILDESTYNYDMDLYYEDLIFNKDERSVETPKPKNYKKLYDFANSLVNSTKGLGINGYEKEFILKHFPNQEIKL